MKKKIKLLPIITTTQTNTLATTRAKTALIAKNAHQMAKNAIAIVAVIHANAMIQRML